MSEKERTSEPSCRSLVSVVEGCDEVLVSKEWRGAEDSALLRASDTQFPYFGLEGGPLHAELRSGAGRTANDSLAFPQRPLNVLAFGHLKRGDAAGWNAFGYL